MFKKFPFHNVEKRPWPLLVSFRVLGLLLNSVLYFHQFISVRIVLAFLLILILMTRVWWLDVIKERLLGFHNSFVLSKFYIGMIILIVSEVFFFLRFFWAFFHKCWAPTPEIGKIWPPAGMEKIMVDCFSIPFLKTVILLSSGVRVTWAHHRILANKKFQRVWGLGVTVFLGFVFLLFQKFEYAKSLFGFKRTIYGSCFYMLTGFHGGHVIIGTIFLIVCLVRAVRFQFTSDRHVGLELAIWYWHFVDVVWLFLFIFVYWYRSQI